MPPLPSPGNVIRCRLFWGGVAPNEFAARFYLQYTGGPVSSADANTLAANVQAAYITHLVPLLNSGYLFKGVDTVDLSSDVGNEGESSTSTAGTRGAGEIPVDVCVNISFEISRRYRGGKPKIFLPPGADTDVVDINAWSSGYVTLMQAAWGAFMAEVLANTYSSFVLEDNVNVSWYKGFTVFITPSGRAQNRPTLRATPVVDPVTNHTVRQIVGSQRRRRTAAVTP